MNLQLRKIYLFLGDIILLFAGLYLTLVLRYGNAKLWPYHIMPFAVLFIFLIITMYVDGLYEFDFGKNRTEILNKLVITIIITALFASVFFYFGHNRFFTIRPQRVLLVNSLVNFFALFMWRIFFYRFLRSPKFAQNTLVIGSGDLTQETIKKLADKPELGFALRAIITADATSQIPAEHVPILNDMEKLTETCKKYQIQTIIFDDRLKQDKSLLRGLFECLPLNITFYELSNFYERLTGKIPVDYIEHVWFLENLREGSKKVYAAAKRLFDVVFSLLFLLISLPFIPFILALIRLDSTGPLLFKQIRVGKSGKHFRAVKFRTMVTDAETAGPQWAQKNDPRITRIGRFLRKTRIDEIPQLWNILKGEMSLIGPRPERPEFVSELKKSIPFYEERLLVVPGLTGWAQVMGPAYGGSVDETLEKIQYDLYYIKNRSLGLDLSILLKTIKTVLSRQGQ